MVYYDDFIFSSGPWSSLDKFLYSHQASELFLRLYGIYAERINDEYSLCNIYVQAYSLGVLVFLDNHPELHCSDFVESATCDFNGDDSGQINDETSAAILLTLYALIKCKKRKTLVTAMFADKIFKMVSEQVVSKESLKNVGDWPQRVSNIVEDIHENGGLPIDLVAMGFVTYEDIVEALDMDFKCCSSLTTEDFKRYIRLGRDVDEQRRIYKILIRKVNEASEESRPKRIHISGVYEKHLYIPEFALPEYYEFQSYLTLGAVDPEEEAKSVCNENQKESCDDNCRAKLLEELQKQNQRINELEEENRILKEMKDNEETDVAFLEFGQGKGKKIHRITAREVGQLVSDTPNRTAIGKEDWKKLLSKITGLKESSFQNFIR